MSDEEIKACLDKWERSIPALNRIEASAMFYVAVKRLYDSGVHPERIAEFLFEHPLIGFELTITSVEGGSVH